MERAIDCRIDEIAICLFCCRSPMYVWVVNTFGRWDCIGYETYSIHVELSSDDSMFVSDLRQIA